MSPNDDGNQEQPTGGTESPTSSPSGGQGQQLSPDVSALVKQVDDLKKEIRGLQKGTDKRFEKFDGNIKRILELKEQGLTEPQIQRELWIDQQMQGQNPHPPEPVGNENSRQAPDVESAFRKLEEYQLPQDDANFLALIRRSSGMDKTAFEVEVNNYVLGKVKPQKPANPADVVQSPVTSAAVGERSASQLEADYQKEIAAIAQTHKGDAKIKAITDLKTKYREAGLQKY